MPAHIFNKSGTVSTEAYRRESVGDVPDAELELAQKLMDLDSGNLRPDQELSLGLSEFMGSQDWSNNFKVGAESVANALSPITSGLFGVSGEEQAGELASNLGKRTGAGVEAFQEGEGLYPSLLSAGQSFLFPGESSESTPEATPRPSASNAVAQATSQSNPLPPQATEAIKTGITEGSQSQQEAYRKVASGKNPNTPNTGDGSDEIDKGTWDSLSTDTKAHLVALGVGALASGLGANQQFMGAYGQGFQGARQAEAQAQQNQAMLALKASQARMKQQESQLDRESREESARIRARGDVAAADARDVDKQSPTFKQNSDAVANLLTKDNPGAISGFFTGQESRSEEEIRAIADEVADRYAKLPLNVREKLPLAQYFQQLMQQQ